VVFLCCSFHSRFLVSSRSWIKFCECRKCIRFHMFSRMKSRKGVFIRFLCFQVIAYVTDPPYLLAVSWCIYILTFSHLTLWLSTSWFRVGLQWTKNQWGRFTTSFFAKERRMFSKSKHNRLYIVIFIIRLTTCFGPCAGPSSGHKIYMEETTIQYES
jgi:hypothetical protein